MNNYQIGRNLEYKIKHLLEEHLDPDRYEVIRTAGSHSAVDLVILETRTKKYCGIQCKSRLK